MELLEMLLGRNTRRRSDSGLSGAVGTFSRWIVGCGCLLIGGVVAGVVLLVAGIISFSSNAMTVIIVIVTIIVATASLIRSSLAQY